MRSAKAPSRRPPGARCSWTRSASCRWQRMIIATDADVIALDDVPAEIRDASGTGGMHGADGTGAGVAPTSFHALRAEAERRIIVAALERNHWHITKSAQDLGLSDHASLLKIMRRHGISRE